MANLSTPAVGIDLGTTNSVVAYVTDAGRTAMLDNEMGDYVTPSAVYFDDDGTVVGRAAIKAGLIYPEKVAREAKRDLGQPLYEQPLDYPSKSAVCTQAQSGAGAAVTSTTATERPTLAPKPRLSSRPPRLAYAQVDKKKKVPGEKGAEECQ